MLSFTQFNENVNNTLKTQVATTGNTYVKSGKILKDKIPDDGKVINIGAGLDHTREGLRQGLDGNHTIHDMEPNPSRRKAAPEFTDATKIPKHGYDGAVCHNVLNVVEPHTRELVMHSIFNSLKPGGHAIIGARGWKGDIDQNKNGEPSKQEPRAMWVKKGNEHSYQKGFDGNEMKDYVEDYARRNGHKVTVTKLPGVTKAGVHVHIHGDA